MQVQREISLAVVPKPMVQPMRLDRMEALEIEEWLDQPRACRGTIQHRRDIGLRRLDNASIVLRRLAEGLHDERQGDRVILQAGRDPVKDRRLEAWLVEDGIEEQ